MELLAPAGNWDMLRAAVYSGADAVYLGLDDFNARIKADNFTCDNIIDVTTFCHLHAVKVYVVINISVKDGEKSRLSKYIKACGDACVDAFIVSDIGIIKYFDEYAPNVPLHASTQMAIHNVEGARIAKRLGFSRIVVARETLLQDIMRIKAELDIEIEYFVHGALCVAFSGNCLFSSILSGNSGNRGRCLQPCRQKYTSSLNGKTAYMLSPKDQCLLDKLDELERAGVDSLKIEGRLKSRNYVSSVVSCYRYTLTTGKINQKLYDNMLKAFNRGEFTKGYNFDNTRNIMNPKVQGNIGLSIGRIVNSNKNNFEVETKYPLKDKIGLKILSKDGEELGGLMINNIKTTKRGFIVPTSGSYPIGSDVRITLDEDSEIEKRRLLLDFDVMQKSNILEIKAKYRNIEAVASQEFEYATNKASSSEDIEKSLYKLNDTEFGVGSISIMYNDDLFLPKSMLNALRRDVIDKVCDNIIFDYNTSMEMREKSAREDIVYNRDKLRYSTTIEVENEYMITYYNANNANIVINVGEFCYDSIQSIINNAIKYNSLAEILLKLPNVARGKDIDNIRDVLSKLKGVTGIYADNLYAIEIANDFGLKVMGGMLLNIYNIDSVNALGLTNYMVSAELNANELGEFDSSAYIFSYGYLPLMTLTHCPLQLSLNSICHTCLYRGVFTYSDSKESFSIRRTKNINCIFTLYNAKKHNIIAKMNRLHYNNYISFVNIDIDYDKVLKAYIDRDMDYREDNITYGHLFRGVK